MIYSGCHMSSYGFLILTAIYQLVITFSTCDLITTLNWCVRQSEKRKKLTHFKVAA